MRCRRSLSSGHAITGSTLELGRSHGLLNQHGGTHAKAFETYRWQVYARGSVPSKEGQASIPEHVAKDILESPFQLGRPADGESREHLRFFVDGLILGPKTLIAEWLGRLRKDGVCKRRQNPHTLADESEGFDICSLREQRRHFEGGKQVSVRHALPFL